MRARFILLSRRLPSHRARLSFARARVVVVAAAVAGMVALGVTPLVSASAAAGAQTVFVNDSFTGASVSGYIKPSAPAGTNVACLTASSNTSGTPVPGCSSTPIDAAGSGALRLTSAGTTQEGGIGASQSVPISKGLDASFESYQYGGSAADGIVFYLAVTDPYNPQVPTAIGQAGGSLGYSATGGTSPGLAHGYLGLGLDVYGNYLNSSFDGTGCSTAPGGKQATNVTVRGPGNGTAGYCVLPGYDSSIGGTGALHGSTRAGSQVPVEVVINPSASTTNFTDAAFASSPAVAARSYAIAFTTIGATTPTIVTGTLPDLRNAAYTGLVDPSWYDPGTGLPYKLTYGWVASTGGSTDVHEVNNLDVQTVNGPVPVLAATSSLSTATPEHASAATYTVSPSVSSTGGTETSPVRVTTTFPAGITPGTYAGTDYTCTLSGQTETCTYTGTTAAGSSLPALALPFSATGTASGTAQTISSVTASTDATAVTSVASVTITKIATTTTLAVSPASPTYGSAETFTATVSPTSATGTVAFVDGTTGKTLCAAAVVTAGVATCTTTTAGPVGSHTITASYSGDANNAASAGTLTVSTQAIATSITVAASPGTVEFGSTSTLTASGLPGAAGGTITFTDADGNTLCTSATGSRSCTTSTTLAAGSYAVTAAYSGDAYYAPTTSTNTASLVIDKATATITDTVNGASSASTVYGTPATLGTQGLATGATGTITYTDADGTTLCTATLPNATCASSATLAAGSYDVTARYSGDANHAAATTAVAAQLTVTKVAAPTLIVSVDKPSLPFGTVATFDTAGVASDATGTLTYTTADGATLCTATLPVTSCATSSTLQAASYEVTATYSGDANHVGGTSGGVSLTVTKAVGTLASTVNGKAAATITHGGTAELDAAGVPAGATGTVSYRDASGDVLCTATLPDASCVTSADLAGGTYTVTAEYSGDGNHQPATAPVVALTVAPQASVITAKVKAKSSTTGVATTITATGTPDGATGTLTFTSNGKVLCMATLPETSCTTTDLAPGDHSVVVSYSGDPSYAPSQTTITVTVPDAVNSVALAKTGSTVAIAGTVGTAGALIALGVLLLIVSRRRRGRHAH